MVIAQQKRPGVLVGRSREVAELERALDRLASGGRGVLELIGEPGIGKSRLISELARRAEERGFLVLEGRAAEFERDIPFGLVVDALNDYLGAVGPAFLRALGDPAVGELAWIFPSLSRFGSGAVAPRAGAERHRAHYAMRAALERVAAEQPVVVLLDDVHWADPASVELLGHLLRRFNGALLAAFAFRRAPPELVTALDAAERSDLATRLELAPLTAEESDALLDSQLDAASRAALFRESGGNPFYLEELQRAVSRPGGGRSAQAAVSAPQTGEPAPPSVVTAIRNEVAGVSEPARLVLDAAAVAGESFELDLVAAIAGQAEPAALLALDELLEADLVRPTAAPRRFRFRHPIVRRTVYETMPGGSRLGSHARAAAALAAPGGSLAARAHHVERSAAIGDLAAIALLEEAAGSVALRAPLTAGRWLATAVRLLPETTARERRLGLLIEASATLGHAGAPEEALAFVEQALPLVAPEETGERARLIVQVAAAKRQTGHPLESRTVLADALATLDDPCGTEALMLRVELVLGHYFAGDFARMGELARQVLATALERQEAALACLGASLASIAATTRGQVADGFAAFDEARRAFTGLSDEQLAASLDVCGWIGLAATGLERSDEALAATRRGLSIARATGQGAGVPGLLGLEAQALLLQGRASEALQVAEAAADAALLSGNDQLLTWALQTSATAATSAGALDGAVFSAREAVALAQRVEGGFLAPLAQLVLAGALLAAGDAAGARCQLDGLDAEPAAALLDLSAGRGWELLARTHLELGDIDAADDVATRAQARAATWGLPLRTAAAQWAGAAVLLAKGDAARAAGVAEDAAGRADAAGNPLLASRARALAGRALAEHGDHRHAIAALEQALGGLRDAGARREADAVARELRRLGQRVRPPARAAANGLGGLSAREREVADQVAAGKTNRAVAETLYLSEKTIESHLARIYTKLGLRSRVTLAALVERERSRS